MIRVVDGEKLPEPEPPHWQNRGLLGDIDPFNPFILVFVVIVGGALDVLGRLVGSLATGGFVGFLAWLLVGDIGAAAVAGVAGYSDRRVHRSAAALVLAAEGADGLVHLRPHIWTPAATMVDRGQRDRVDYALWSAQGHLEALPGPTIDLEAIAYRLAELCSEYPVERIMFDRWRMAELKRWLEKIGAWHVINVLAEHGQGFRDMTVAVEVMSQLALEEKLRHGRHPVLRWCMSNLEIDRDPAGNAKPDKSEHFGRVDAAVAAMMACRSLRGDVGKPGIEAGQMFFL